MLKRLCIAVVGMLAFKAALTHITNTNETQITI